MGGLATAAMKSVSQPDRAGMREYEIYLPTTRNDGAPADAAEIDRIKRTLTEAFGGYTHLRQRSEGALEHRRRDLSG